MTEGRAGLWSQVCGQFLRFGVVGVFSVLFNVVAYAVLVYLGVHYLVASGIGWAGGVTGSYILNRTYTFRSTGARAGEFARYWIVYVMQLVISWTGLILLIDWVGLGPFVAYAINVVIVTAVSFFGLRRFVFNAARK